MATEITGAPDDEAVRHSIADGVFDAVVCAMALHWLPDTIGAVARAPRPGGVLGS